MATPKMQAGDTVSTKPTRAVSKITVEVVQQISHEFILNDHSIETVGYMVDSMLADMLRDVDCEVRALKIEFSKEDQEVLRKSTFRSKAGER